MANEVGLNIPFELSRFDLPPVAEEIAAIKADTADLLEGLAVGCPTVNGANGIVDRSDPARIKEAYLLAIGYLTLGVTSSAVVIPFTTGDDFVDAKTWIGVYAGYLSCRAMIREDAVKKIAALDAIRQ